MTPNYTVKKSIAASLSPLCIIFFWLIIPLIIQIVRILNATCETIEFYDDKIVCKSGILNKRERQSVFAGVYCVSIEQSLIGRILNYGDIAVDAPGKWDVSMSRVHNPKGLKSYLESKITTKNTNFIIGG